MTITVGFVVGSYVVVDVDILGQEDDSCCEWFVIHMEMVRCVISISWFRSLCLCRCVDVTSLHGSSAASSGVISWNIW